MAFETEGQRNPPITLGRTEHERLSQMADAFAAKNAAVAQQLAAELDRAEVVADGRLGPDVVRMGSTLRFTTDTGEDRTVTLVFPGEADIAAGRLSIFTPIGAALIGLAAGQSIDWTGRDGRGHRLTVVSVQAGGDEG